MRDHPEHHARLDGRADGQGRRAGVSSTGLQHTRSQLLVLRITSQAQRQPRPGSKRKHRPPWYSSTGYASSRSGTSRFTLCITSGPSADPTAAEQAS